MKNVLQILIPSIVTGLDRYPLLSHDGKAKIKQDNV